MGNTPAQTHSTATAGTEAGPVKQKGHLKKRAIDSTKKFLVMTAYLWAFLAVMSVHKTVVLAQNHINYEEQSFAIVNALVLAKFMLVADDLKLGRRFTDRPLIYPIVWASFVFAIILVFFHIVEHIALALLHGKPLAETLTDLGAATLKGVSSLGAITFVALIPFFAFREIGRAVGTDQLWRLVFARSRKRFELVVRE